MCYTDTEQKKVCYPIGFKKLGLNVALQTEGDLERGIVLNYSFYGNLRISILINCNESMEDENSVNFVSPFTSYQETPNSQYSMTAQAKFACPQNFVRIEPIPAATPSPSASVKPILGFTSPIVEEQSVAIKLDSFNAFESDLVLIHHSVIEKTRIFFNPSSTIPCANGFNCTA
jgi:hypothetical protein